MSNEIETHSNVQISNEVLDNIISKNNKEEENFNKNFSLKEGNLSRLLIIKNPDNEVCLGYCSDNNFISQIQNETMYSTKENISNNAESTNESNKKTSNNTNNSKKEDLLKTIKENLLAENKKSKQPLDSKDCISVNSQFSDKILTYQAFGAADISNYPDLHSSQPSFQFAFSPINQQTFFTYKIEALLIKYTLVILSTMIFILDYKNLKQRLTHQEEIISDLRAIHIQMDDVQLYQIFWSFVLVYCGLTAAYFWFFTLALIYDTYSMIKMAFRVMMFSIIYLFIEIIIKKWDYNIIVIRFILVALLRKLMSINCLIHQAIIFNPEYGNISLYPRYLSFRS